MELAAARVSIALFNQASRITIFPLVSIITSFVAEESTIEKINTEKKLSDKAKSKNKRSVVGKSNSYDILLDLGS
ncbi:hypothetical protein JHK87_009695 [Glycine soja]|nr:hypothetical protein JHK87_009695 [Glycine soja]